MFITQGKINYKYLLIIFIVAFLASVIIWSVLPMGKEDVEKENGFSSMSGTLILASIPTAYGDDSPFCVVSPSGKNFACTISHKDKQVILSNNQKEEEYDTVSDIRFNQNDELAYLAKENNKKFLVYNGKKGKLYDKIYSFDFNFKGEPIYVGRNGEGSIIGRDYVWNGDIFLVTGEDERKCEDASIYVAFKIVNIKENNKWKFIKYDKGKEGDYYDKIIDFASNEGNYIYAAIKGFNRFIVVNGEEKFVFAGNFGEDYYNETGNISWKKAFPTEYGEVKSVYISPDGNNYAYVAPDEDGDKLYINEEDGILVEFIGHNSGIYAYLGSGINNTAYSIAAEDGDDFQSSELVVRGKIVPKSGNVDSFLGFSPNGSHYAFTNKRGSLFLNGKEIDKIGDDFLDYFFDFSPNSEFAYYYNDGETVIYDIEKEVIKSKIKGKVNIVFSADDNHFAYILEESDKYSVVIDGEKGDLYDKIINKANSNKKLDFIDDDRFVAYGAIIGQDVLWVVDEVK